MANASPLLAALVRHHKSSQERALIGNAGRLPGLGPRETRAGQVPEAM
jgi:hypothetical protein